MSDEQRRREVNPAFLVFRSSGYIFSRDAYFVRQNVFRENSLYFCGILPLLCRGLFFVAIHLWCSISRLCQHFAPHSHYFVAQNFCF